jgi:hypothetical protein
VAGEYAAILALIGTAAGLFYLSTQLKDKQGYMQALKGMVIGMGFLSILTAVYVGSAVVDNPDASGNATMSFVNISANITDSSGLITNVTLSFNNAYYSTTNVTSYFTAYIGYVPSGSYSYQWCAWDDSGAYACDTVRSLTV